MRPLRILVGSYRVPALRFAGSAVPPARQAAANDNVTAPRRKRLRRPWRRKPVTDWVWLPFLTLLATLL